MTMMLQLTNIPSTIFYTLILTQAILTTRNAVNPTVTKNALVMPIVKDLPNVLSVSYNNCR